MLYRYHNSKFYKESIIGLIVATLGTVGGGLADQWLEVIEPEYVEEGIVLAKGVTIRTNGCNSNTKCSSDVILNSSIIHVEQKILFIALLIMLVILKMSMITLPTLCKIMLMFCFLREFSPIFIKEKLTSLV